MSDTNYSSETGKIKNKKAAVTFLAFYIPNLFGISLSSKATPASLAKLVPQYIKETNWYTDEITASD